MSLHLPTIVEPGCAPLVSVIVTEASNTNHVRNLLALTPDPAHARPKLALEARLHRSEPTKCRCDCTEDLRRDVVVHKEKNGPTNTKRARELGGEQEDVEGGFEDVSTAGNMS